MKPLVCPADRAAWRDWLDKHHASANEVWLVFYKKHTGKPSVAYRDSVEEAICFGWIDGLKKRIDDERYAHRFTPRKEQSKWSPLSIRLAEQLTAEGLMAPAGLAAFAQRQLYDPVLLQARQSDDLALPREMEKVLRSNRAAWRNFNRLTPGYRRQYVGWLSSAVKPETRRKRLQEVIERLERNQKLGMK